MTSERTCAGCRGELPAGRKRWCTRKCRKFAAVRRLLPRKPGRKPRKVPQDGRCMNCDEALGARDLFFHGDGCEWEWRARLALWRWKEAREAR